MRHSLRTLLAFEDNIFGIEQRRQLERTIPVNEAAVNVLGRIRNAMRHPYLGVPGKINGQEELDANVVAEYLDQQMPQEHIEPFEDFCFSDDKYLAEVASVHQIVSNVLGEPARISRDCRYRCYQLLPSVPPESKEKKTGIIQESVMQDRTVREEPPQNETSQEYRRTTPQDFYSPPPQSNLSPPNSQMKKIDILTGEVLNEPALSVNVRKTDRRPEIVKAVVQSTVQQSAAQATAAVNNDDIPQQAARYVPAANKKPADRSPLTIILTAAVILLSVLCFKLYNDSKNEKQKEHPVSVFPNALTNEMPLRDADDGIPNSTRVPTLRNEKPVKKPAGIPVTQNTAPLPNPLDTALDATVDTSLEAASQNQDAVPQKVADTVKTEGTVAAVCVFPAVSPPVENVSAAAFETAAPEIVPEVPPAPQVAVKSLPTVFDTVVPASTVSNSVVSAEPVAPKEKTAPKESFIAETFPEPAKNVYQFTEHNPAAAKNERGEFSSVQPVISFQPKMNPPAAIPFESVAEHKPPDSKTSDIKTSDSKTARFTINNEKNSSIKINTIKNDAESTAENAAAVKLRQPPSAIIQAGGIAESPSSDKHNGNNTGNNPAVPQKNVVLGRTVETDRSTVLFTAKSADSPWQIETGKIDIVAEQYLLTSAPFRCTIELNGRHHSRLLNGFEIEMLGDSKLCVMPLDGNGVPGIYLDYGRIIIRLKNTDGKNLPKELSLRIQTEKTEGILSLTGSKSIVFVDTFAEVVEQRTAEEAALPQNSELPPKSSPIIGLLPDPQETVSWKVSKENKPFTADSDTSFLLDGVSNARGLIQHHPNWIRPVSQPNEAAEIAAVCRRLSEEKNGNCEAVLQSLIRESSVPVRSFGLRLWGDLGRFDVPLTVLSDSKKDNTRDNSSVIPVNRILTAYFREVMKRDEESVQRLSESLQQLRR